MRLWQIKVELGIRLPIFYSFYRYFLLFKFYTMGIISAIQDFFDEDGKNFRKGDAFEACTEKFFPSTHYDCVERTHDSKTNRTRFVESSLKPDFKFRDKKTGKCFYVESKYRSGLTDSKILWSNPKQLLRYQDYNKECPVFILIGFMGKPTDPDEVFLIPLSKAKYIGLFPGSIKDFLVELELITTRELWNR